MQPYLETLGEVFISCNRHGMSVAIVAIEQFPGHILYTSVMTVYPSIVQLSTIVSTKSGREDHRPVYVLAEGEEIDYYEISPIRGGFFRAYHASIQY